MDINTQSLKQHSTASFDNSKTTSFEPLDKKQETIQPSDVTVNVSSAAAKMSSSTQPPPSPTQIKSQEQAQDSVKKFLQQAANEPVLTQQMQSNNLTPEIITGLIT